MTAEREPKPRGWLVARRFSNVTSALKAYEAARDLLLTEDLDASVLRFTLDGQSHVAVLGESPLPPAGDEKMRAIIEPGSEVVELPEQIADKLRARRREFKNLGLNYLERRTGPNPDVRDG